MAKTKEEKAAYGRTWYANNKEAYLTKQKTRRNANKQEYKETQRQYRETHKEEIKEHRKNLTAEQLEKRRESYRKYARKRREEHSVAPSTAEKRKLYTNNWLEQNRYKNNAQQRYREAVKTGKIDKVSVCVVCASTTKIKAHHFSYAYEHHLHVIGLCAGCHAAVHRGIEFQQVNDEIQKFLLATTQKPADTVEWRDIPGYIGYQASVDGRIRSVDRQVERKSKTGVCLSFVSGRELRICEKEGGYCTVNVSHNTSAHVHRLVLLAFVGPPTAGQECRHLDGNPSNNQVSNLMWGTAKENFGDRIAHGTARVHGKHVVLDEGKLKWVNK